MIAMQYSFTLPADYDMSVIDRRIREKGHALDHHSPLSFKAYLVARKESALTRSPENLYAPFYLWRSCEGMRDFIASAGFAGLVNAFGWPVVRSWPAVVSVEQSGDPTLAGFASRELRQIAAFDDLDAFQRAEQEASRVAVQDDGALLALAAFEPTTWTAVRFRLWRDAKSISTSHAVLAYEVEHVSNPA